MKQNRMALLLALGLAGFVFVAGCAQREHKKVRVVEEQREGEVQEEKPGEMIVE